MYKKIVYLILLVLSLSGKSYAQTEQGQSPVIDVIPSDSEINLSTAEFQSLVEEIMQFKRKRQEQAAAYAHYQQQFAVSRKTVEDSVSVSVSTPNDDTRIDEMEKLLIQMNERMKYSQTSTPNTITSGVEKKDLDNLEIELKEEIASIKKTIYESSLKPPPTVLYQEDQSAAYQEAQKDYYYKYATQMVLIRQSIDSLSWRLNNLSSKTDYSQLERQLALIEAKIQRPVIIQQDQNSSSPQQEPVIVQMDNTAYLEAQFKDIRRLIAEVKTNQPTKTPVVTTPVIVETSPKKETAPANNLDTEKLMAQWNAQYNELKAMIAQLQAAPPVVAVPEQVIVPAEKEIVYVEIPGETKTIDRVERIISGNEKRKLFFDNNSIQPKSEYQYILEETVSALLSAPELDIILVGFASQKGSVAYNQKLSRQRAETVKQYLINKGISSSRILAKHHGVDLSATDEASGRRVDMVLVRN